MGKQLPPLQTHAFEWVLDWVTLIPALHHAIDKVEKRLVDGIRHLTNHVPIIISSLSFFSIVFLSSSQSTISLRLFPPYASQMETSIFVSSYGRRSARSLDPGLPPWKELWLRGRFGKQSTGKCSGRERLTTARRYGRGWKWPNRTGKLGCEQRLCHSNNWTRLTHGGPLRNERSTNRTQENRRQGYWNHNQRRADLTPMEVGATISIRPLKYEDLTATCWGDVGCQHTAESDTISR